MPPFGVIAALSCKKNVHQGVSTISTKAPVVE